MVGALSLVFNSHNLPAILWWGGEGRKDLSRTLSSGTEAAPQPQQLAKLKFYFIFLEKLIVVMVQGNHSLIVPIEITTQF